MWVQNKGYPAKIMMKVLREIIKNVSVILFMGVLVIAFAAVVFRYVFNNSIVWAEEAIRYISIWIFFLTMFEATRTGSHIALDLIPGMLKGKAKIWLNILIEGINIVFDVVLVYYGWKLTLVNMAQRSAALRIPYGYVYAAIPVGAALMGVFSVLRIVRFGKQLAGKEVEEVQT